MTSRRLPRWQSEPRAMHVAFSHGYLRNFELGLVELRHVVGSLKALSKNDLESRPLIAEAGGILYLSEALYSPSAISQENATATLLNISIPCREPLMSTCGLLDALSHALRNPASPSTAQSAAATLFSLLTLGVYRPIIGSKRDILYALINIVRNPNSHPRSIKDSLKALFVVSLYPLNRSTLIELGAVPALFSLVVKDGRVGIVEDATAVIAQIARCEEAGDAFRKVSGIGMLVDLLDLSIGSSNRTKENSVSALLNMVHCGKEECVEYVKEMAFVVCDGIADVANNGSSKGKSKASKLLKIIDSAATIHGFDEPQFDYVIGAVRTIPSWETKLRKYPWRKSHMPRTWLRLPTWQPAVGHKDDLCYYISYRDEWC